MASSLGPHTSRWNPAEVCFKDMLWSSCAVVLEKDTAGLATRKDWPRGNSTTHIRMVWPSLSPGTDEASPDTQQVLCKCVGSECTNDSNAWAEEQHLDHSGEGGALLWPELTACSGCGPRCWPHLHVPNMLRHPPLSTAHLFSVELSPSLLWNCTDGKDLLFGEEWVSPCSDK